MSHQLPATGAALIATLVLGAAGGAQQSAQLFDAPVLVVPDNQQRMNALLDLDGDGWTDAVGTFWKAEDEVAVSGFLGDGAGGLDPLFEVTWTQYGGNDLAFPIATADLNGDGRDDFVIGVRDDFQVFLSNGAAAPTLIHDVHTGSGKEIQDLTLGDYDGDGEIEAAVRLQNIIGSTSDTGLRIYDGLVAGPHEAQFIQPAPGAGYVLKNVEADGDGVTDLMCIGDRLDFFSVKGGALVGIGSYALGTGQEPNGASGDVDGDGDEDVVVFDKGGQYRVLRRVGPASFALEAPQVGGPATELADVDGDGDPDGVCCAGGGYDTLYNTAPSVFEISINDGTGAFAPSFQLASLGANEIAGVDDVDQDGDADLVAGRVVYYNVGGIAPASYPELSGLTPAEWIHDVDGDGDPDAQTGPDGFDRNRGDGVFEPVARIAPAPPAGSQFEGVGVHGDFDGDGDVDLIVQETQGGVALHERLLLNTGGGGLVDGGAATAPGVTFVDPTSFGDTLVGDLDGDGRLDVIARESSPVLTTRVFAQQPDGTFALGVVLAGEYAKDVADVDGDGFDDLVTLSDAAWRVRFGDATASMAAELSPAQPTTGSFWFAFSATAGDLDGDGDLDLVGPLHVQGESFYKDVRVLENVGPRQFVVHDDLFPEYRGVLAPVHVADVNQDGAPDLALGQRYDEGADETVFGTTFFLGDPAPGLDFTLAGADAEPLLWHLADLDGDGDLDGIDGNTVYFNNATQVPAGGYRLQYGSGTPGTGGQVPTLGAVGPFQGGSTIELRITGAAPNTTGLLFVGTADQPLDLPAFGGLLEVLPVVISLPVATPSATGEWGSGTLHAPVGIHELVSGLSFYHQAGLFDPAAQGGASLTNALRLTYGE